MGVDNQNRIFDHYQLYPSYPQHSDKYTDLGINYPQNKVDLCKTL